MEVERGGNMRRLREGMRRNIIMGDINRHMAEVVAGTVVVEGRTGVMLGMEGVDTVVAADMEVAVVAMVVVREGMKEGTVEEVGTEVEDMLLLLLGLRQVGITRQEDKVATVDPLQVMEDNLDTEVDITTITLNQNITITTIVTSTDCFRSDYTHFVALYHSHVVVTGNVPTDRWCVFNDENVTSFIWLLLQDITRSHHIRPKS